MAAGTPGVAVRYSGLRELRAELRRLEDPRYWGREFREAGKQAAGLVAREAQSRVPQLTGRLRDSIRPLASQTRAQVAAGKAAVPYAGVIEFGWPARNIRPQPYLYPAAEALGDEVADFYLTAVDRLTRRAFPE